MSISPYCEIVYTEAMKFKDLETSTQVILKVVLIGLGLAFLWTIREIIVLLLFAIVLAAAMEPLADYLHKKRIPRGASVIAVYVVVIGLVGLVISTVIPVVIEQGRVLVSDLPSSLVKLETQYPALGSVFGKDAVGEFVKGAFTGSGEGGVFSRTVDVFNSVFGVITVLVISFYLVVAQQKGTKELVRPLVPLHRQEQVMQLITKIQRKMGLWVLGQIIVSLAIFIFTYIGLSILGVKYALVLALIAGILEVVPYIGPTLSAVPALFVALLQSPPLAVGVLILYILVQKSENYILLPKVMEKTVGVSPLVVVLSLLIGFKLAGVVGLLLAVPLAGALVSVIEEFRGEAKA